MPRSDLRDGHEAQEVGAAIIAAWLKALPASPTEISVPITATKPELTTALQNVLRKSVNVIYDDPSSDTITVVVPAIPKDIKTRSQLLNYLQIYHDKGEGRHYHEELGQAVLFGCR